MHYIKLLFFFGCYLVSINSYSQSNFVAFNESAFSVNHKVSSSYAANFAIETRYFLYQKERFFIKQRQVDLSHFSTFFLNHNYSLSLGIEYRNRDIFEDSSNELRISEQINYKKRKLGVRFGHRFRSEQRLLRDKVIFRQRYRLALDFPLNGEKLDIGEAYLVNTLENLFSLSETDKPETDIRIATHIGWQITEALKLQTGLEYRAEAFNLNTENVLFILTSAVLKI